MPSSSRSAIGPELLRRALCYRLTEVDLPGLPNHYRGKVRDNYSLPDGRRILVATDRQSAFDQVLAAVPFKGQVLNRLASWWFAKTADAAPNHLLSVPDPNITVARECEPLPVVMVVRSYVTGVTSTSLWTHYARGERVFCGHRLPDGLRKHEKLAQPILTPSTKAAKGGHDVSVSRDEILAEGKISAADFDEAARIAHTLFAIGPAVCKERGLILVDTKYELGRAPDGTIVVIDEMHTPDSSRFWFERTYAERFEAGQDPESFDKEYVRRWLAKEGFTGDGPIPAIPDDVRVEAARRYIEAYETITGESFVPDTEPPATRMRRNLGL